MNRKFLLLILTIFLLQACKNNGYKSAEVTGKRIPIDSGIAADTSISNFIKPFSENITKTLDSALAFNLKNLNKNDGELNTALGNLMADIVMEQANPVFKSRTGNEIDLVLLNHGGIRSTIPQGPVTARTAYNVMPFENEIVVVEIKGEKIFEMLSYLEKNGTAHPLSGIYIEVGENKKIRSANIAGKEIDTSKTYFVATSDYLQQGGDNMVFFSDPVKLYRVDYKIRNAMIDYFNKVDTIRASRDNRYIQIK